MKKTIIIFTVVILIIMSIFFVKNNYKILKKGNNINIKSADKIEKYILNISSYETNAEITVISNKSKNNYLVKQKYIKENNIFEQEIVKPESLSGIYFIYDGKNLEIKNTKLNLSKVYEKYSYMENNHLNLASFIEDYLNNSGNCYEEKEQIILETTVKNGNKYRARKKLYINKENLNPIKLEIQDINKNILIYILYNEIEINN